jgi:hypothetical protein
MWKRLRFCLPLSKLFFPKKQVVPSRHNTFNVYCLFRAYVFTFSATEANLFVDYLHQAITNPQTENRTGFHAGSAATAVIKNYNGRLHCLQTTKIVCGLGSGSPFDTIQ